MGLWRVSIEAMSALAGLATEATMEAVRALLAPIQATIVTAGDMSGGITSITFDLSGKGAASIEVHSAIATHVGTFSVEGSNTGLTDSWNDIPFSPAVAAASGVLLNELISLPAVTWRYIRLSYHWTSGTGVLNAYAYASAAAGFNGTVTANAGIDLDTSLLATEATLAKLTTVGATPAVIMNAVVLDQNRSSSVVDLRGREDWCVTLSAPSNTHVGTVKVYLSNVTPPLDEFVLEAPVSLSSGAALQETRAIPTGGAAYGMVTYVFGSGTGALTVTSCVR